MKTYTKEEQKENLEGACKELEANSKKAIGRMRDTEGGRCCLCVMEDYAISIDPAIRRGSQYTPSSDLVCFYGLANNISEVDNRANDIELFNFVFENGDYASDCNDGETNSNVKEHTHKEIAARIRAEFLS